jgi:hypothetical protein
VAWSNVDGLENSKFRDMVEIIVACSQTVNPKLIHSSDDQGIVGKEPVPRSDSLNSAQPSFIRRQNEDVQAKDGRCLRLGKGECRPEDFQSARPA